MRHTLSVVLAIICLVLLTWSIALAQEEGGEEEGTPAPEEGEQTPIPSPEAIEAPPPPAEEQPPDAEPIDEPPVEEGSSSYEESAAPAAEESPFRFNGFIQTQGGMFTSTEDNQTRDGFPTDHGSLWGQPSMFRNTLQLEADYQPIPQGRLHAVFRGVRSASLLADRYAQFPGLPADTTFNRDERVQQAKREAVWKNFYNEADLRELYVDIDATSWLNFRLGRQQVAWGETANARLMDMINPIDSTWHLSLLENYEDQRIPMWIAKSLIDIMPISASLELVFVPILVPEETVTIPLTFVGAWGLPVAPKNDYVSDLKIVEKKLIYPDTNLEDARWGANWKHIIGPFSYSLAYYHGHLLSPPIPYYVEQAVQANEEGYHEATVYLHFPRQDTYGASMELVFDRPIGTVVRVEGTYLPDRTYPVSSYMSAGYAPDGGRGWYESPEDPNRTRADFYAQERDTWNYAVVLQRANVIRFLNPTSSIITQFQFIQTIVPEGPYIDEEMADGSKQENKNWYILDIPGYDTTKVAKIATMYAGAITTSYLHGMISPFILGVYDETSQSGLLSTNLNFAFGNNWRIKLGYNLILGDDPYRGLGLFRDRDEVNLRIRYQL